MVRDLIGVAFCYVPVKGAFFQQSGTGPVLCSNGIFYCVEFSSLSFRIKKL
jgi:hypothetical protein